MTNELPGIAKLIRALRNKPSPKRVTDSAAQAVYFQYLKAIYSKINTLQNKSRPKSLLLNTLRNIQGVGAATNRTRFDLMLMFQESNRAKLLFEDRTKLDDHVSSQIPCPS
jgi:hypothetical protein